MDSPAFQPYLPLLQHGPFALYPAPQGRDPAENRFGYVDDDLTHVKIQNVGTQKEYLLPLVLIEFVNPGVVRLSREIRVYNGSFV